MGYSVVTELKGVGVITLVSEPEDCAGDVWVENGFVPVSVIVGPGVPLIVLMLLLESGNGTVDFEVLLIVRDPDATTLLISILVDDAVDRVVTEPRVELEMPELPAVGP